MDRHRVCSDRSFHTAVVPRAPGGHGQAPKPSPQVAWWPPTLHNDVPRNCPGRLLPRSEGLIQSPTALSSWRHPWMSSLPATPIRAFTLSDPRPFSNRLESCLRRLGKAYSPTIKSKRIGTPATYPSASALWKRVLDATTAMEKDAKSLVPASRC